MKGYIIEYHVAGLIGREKYIWIHIYLTKIHMQVTIKKLCKHNAYE